MHSVKLYSALLAAGASVASAATCTTDIMVATATPTIACDVVNGNIIVDSSVSGELSIEGPKQIMGDVRVANVSNLLAFSSTSINSIKGTLLFQTLELLSSIKLPSLTHLQSLDMLKLPQLNELVLGADGIESASSITISDTFLGNLDSLRVKSCDNFEVVNNHKLTTLNLPTVNITKLLSVNGNGNNMVITLNDLERGGEMQFSDIQELKIPKLRKLTGSIKFDKNPRLESISAGNLESVADSVTSINNNGLTNVSFPVLRSVGDLTIQNNTALTSFTFPGLETVSGGIILRGSFTNVSFPKLQDIKGGVTVTSTADIGNVCDYFDGAKQHGIIQGSEKCTSNNTKANEGGDGGSTGHGSGSNEQSAAGSIANNMGFALGLMILTGVAQLL